MLQDHNRTTVKKLKEQAGFHMARVLEVGCGPGRVTSMYADLPVLVAGLEVEWEDVRRASLTIPKGCFIAGSGVDIPVHCHVFDIVLFTLSLHHLPDPAKGLREARRVLRPDGRILVLEPTPESEIQRLCTIFVNEDHRLARAEETLRQSDRHVLSRETFTTEWVFEDFQELAGYAFAYYDQAGDAETIRAMKDFLGPKAEQTPLSMTDTLRLTCLGT